MREVDGAMRAEDNGAWTLPPHTPRFPVCGSRCPRKVGPSYADGENLEGMAQVGEA
jgi:hypothetical protein